MTTSPDNVTHGDEIPGGEPTGGGLSADDLVEVLGRLAVADMPRDARVLATAVVRAGGPISMQDAAADLHEDYDTRKALATRALRRAVECGWIDADTGAGKGKILRPGRLAVPGADQAQAPTP
jgi:hypothetical protein